MNSADKPSRPQHPAAKNRHRGNFKQHVVLAMGEADGKEDKRAGYMGRQQPVKLGEAVHIDEAGNKAEANHKGAMLEFFHAAFTKMVYRGGLGYLQIQVAYSPFHISCVEAEN